jgi:cephalosporin hydroxylase
VPLYTKNFEIKSQEPIQHFYNKIHGWFDFQNLYTKMVNDHADNSHFVEVGAFYGKSAAYMAVEIANSKKQIKFDVVDTWRGSPEHQKGAWDYKSDMVEDTAFEVFKQNMSPAEGYYNPVKLASTEAAKLYADGSLDFVFIDAAHEYESVKEDIEAWYPKVKPGGYIGGHDYVVGKYGVYRAVDERFEKDFELFGVSWLHQIKQL